MDEETWYIRSKGKVAGPFTESQLRSLISRGRFSRTHDVSKDKTIWQQADALIDQLSAPVTGSVAGPAAAPPINYTLAHAEEEDQPASSMHAKYLDDEDDDEPLELRLDEKPSAKSKRSHAGKSSRNAAAQRTRSGFASPPGSAYAPLELEEEPGSGGPEEPYARVAERMELPLLVLCIVWGVYTFLLAIPAVVFLSFSLAAFKPGFIAIAIIFTILSVGFMGAFTYWHWMVRHHVIEMRRRPDSEWRDFHLAKIFRYLLYLYRLIMWTLVASVLLGIAGPAIMWGLLHNQGPEQPGFFESIRVPPNTKFDEANRILEGSTEPDFPAIPPDRSEPPSRPFE